MSRCLLSTLVHLYATDIWCNVYRGLICDYLELQSSFLVDKISS